MAICEHNRVDVPGRVAAPLQPVGAERVRVEPVILDRPAPSRRVPSLEATRA
jgi:hypothetical protein